MLPKAYVIQGLVINAVGLVSIFNQLMYGQGSVVRFHDSIRNLQNKVDNVGPAQRSCVKKSDGRLYSIEMVTLSRGSLLIHH